MAGCVIVSKPMNLYIITAILSCVSLTRALHINKVELTAAQFMLDKTTNNAMDVSVELLKICVTIILLGMLHGHLVS